MALTRAQFRPKQIWQLPLLLTSLGLFGYAGYLVIDPKPGLTLAQRIDVAQIYVRRNEPETAITLLNKELNASKIPPAQEARIHLLLAESLAKGQQVNHLNIESNHEQIIEQTSMALKLGVKGDADTYRRLAESYQAMDKSGDAIAAYRRAAELDPDHSSPLLRRVVELQLASDNSQGAEAALSQYLKSAELPPEDRAWAMGRKARILADRGEVKEAGELLEEALKLDANPLAQGAAHYYQGYCAWKQDDLPQAERLLRVARDQLKAGDPLDAHAAYLLGRIYQKKDDPRQAISFYDYVVNEHPESDPAPLARLGRGQCRILLGEAEPGLADLHELVRFIAAKPSRDTYRLPAIAGFQQALSTLSAQENLKGALEVLADEQSLDANPGPDFFGRLGAIYERRADQLEKSPVNIAKAEDVAKQQEQVSALRANAGQAYAALSHKLTGADDRANAEALWHAIGLFDRAGAGQLTIVALEQFLVDRPSDALAPEARLRLGRAYLAGGQFDKAIKVFQVNQFLSPQSLAASKSGVPLAQTYIAMGSEHFAKAERVLLAVVENNPILTPEAEEFREALFELAQLYYRTGRYEEAIGRLEEMTQRYPNDTQSGRITFLMADSYRKSAALLADAAKVPATQPTVAAGAAATPTPAELAAARDEAAAARTQRLTRAGDLFSQTIERFGRPDSSSAPTDVLYQKLAWFYRADCMFDLGRYEDAIRFYSSATLRYQDDPAALAGYIQIVNAYCALGRREDARAANERARWLLRKMPTDAFDKAKSSLSKQYWDDWLKWSSDSGLLAHR
ncbi:MAG TPA: tetratricopeptide repeat protein [Humisphaera sp.]|nr:tetratricopeptide repeat protein [Humisphaera sp.]